jgi:hypothetical protein
VIELSGVLECVTHPNYTGKWPPRRDCKGCSDAYKIAMIIRLGRARFLGTQCEKNISLESPKNPKAQKEFPGPRYPNVSRK